MLVNLNVIVVLSTKRIKSNTRKIHTQINKGPLGSLLFARPTGRMNNPPMHINFALAVYR